MKVFFDEDIGKNIPRALRSVRAPAERIEYPRASDGAPIRNGTKDPDWIPWAGENGFIVISYNYLMLENPLELDLLLRHEVGVFYIRDAQVEMWQILGLLASRWAWITSASEMTPRPFCYLLSLRGAPEQYDMRTGPRRPSAVRGAKRDDGRAQDVFTAPAEGIQLGLFTFDSV